MYNKKFHLRNFKIQPMKIICVTTYLFLKLQMKVIFRFCSFHLEEVSPMLNLLAIFVNASVSHVLWNYSLGCDFALAFPHPSLCTYPALAQNFLLPTSYLWWSQSRVKSSVCSWDLCSHQLWLSKNHYQTSTQRGQVLVLRPSASCHLPAEADYKVFHCSVWLPPPHSLISSGKLAQVSAFFWGYF